MNYNDLLEIAAFSPKSLKFPNSWLGHLPFAAWVIQDVSPNIFVELGTHSGNSYFSFCQAVAEAGISTKCYAVDTWQGDEHAGQYGDEIFAKVDEHHQANYAGFSRLLRMTFDDAATYFSDDSIELLHIDGLHTYEAVRHDFETWLPKLAPGAVVMFHDINVRERDFGVWKLWEELKTQYPNHLEFMHSHGLGVLQLNNVPDDKKLDWLLPNSPEKQRMVKYFAALGSRQLERFDFSQVIAARESEVANLKQHTTNLSQVIAARDYEVADLKQHTSNLTQVIAARDHEVADLKQHTTNLSQIVAARESEVADLKQYSTNLSQVIAARDYEVADLKQHAANLTQIVAARESEAANFQKSLAEREEQIRNFQGISERAEFLEGQLKDAKNKIDEFLSSTSWRITEPLRTLRGCLRKKRRPNRFVCSDQLAVSEAVPQNTEAVEQHNDLLLDSSDFDAEFYHKAYPDTHGLDPYFHYSNFGKNEGRLPCAPAPVVIDELKKLDRSKETVLIVSHEASRTGAPILALNIAQHFKEKKYNVIVFLLRGGDLLADFQEHCDIVVEPFPQSHNAYAVSIVLEQLISQAGLKFAIVNSIVSRSVLPALSNCFVPSLCLIHEFASYTYPKTSIRDVVLWANQVVFSARIVYENNATECDVLDKYNPVILPQGKCVVPHAKDTKEVDEKENKRIRKLFRPDTHDDNTIVILGAGFVQLRKGVDLFLTCAARVAALCPQNSFRFIWVGQGFDPDLDLVYSAYLQDQINRAGLENRVCFTGEIADIDLAYELSDVLFLSSRLDPLPNVAIDAMFQQLPVICFDNTTGIADLLKENGLGEACVIPYLDVEQAAQRLFSLIEDSDQRIRLGKEINEVGKKLFDMRLYVDSLERQAMDCLASQEIEKQDCAVIEEDGTLNLDFFSPPAWSALSYKKAVRAFVRTWRSGIDMRKPFPGFHPGIYEDFHGVSQTGSNPLAAFIQAGKPEGPWLCDLIQPSPPVQMGSELPLRAALHIHVFFVDLFLDILQRLEGQNLHLDLLISVPSSEVAEEVGVLASGYTYGIVDIRNVPNRGRDIGPLLTEFSETIFNNYDVIGHVHTKKSGDVQDPATGEIWFRFLLENLIGKKYPMASIILERIAGNEKLGIVFPDDPNIIGWSGNKLIAENLAHQFDINELPDLYFNFPVGTMFWARTQALKPLLARNFKWEDYPEEPLPYDGTILHSLERLLPFVAKKMGYHMSLTHVPGITR